MSMNVPLLILLLFIACSPRSKMDVATTPVWENAYKGNDPEVAYETLLAYKQAGGHDRKESPNLVERMGTESRLFALAYYLDKPGWESHFREYTNLYQFSPYRSKPSLTYREALFNLEVLEYDMNIRWKTNTARLAIRQPTKSEVREYVLSIGKTNWLRSTRDTNESVFVKQFGVNW